MKGLIASWAREYLFSTGPKAGAPTQIEPESITIEGINPGQENIGAEEMNAIISQALDHVVATRFSGLADFRRSDSVDSNVQLSGAAIHDASGETLFIGRGTSDVDVRFKVAGGEVVEVAGSFQEASSAICSARGPTGVGTYVWIGRSAATGPLLARYQNTAGTVVSGATESHTSDWTTGTSECLDCTHDPINGSTAALVDTGGAGLAFGYFTDADQELLEATYPTMPTGFGSTPNYVHGTRLMASGGGTIMCVIWADAILYAFASTDGGLNWSSVSAPVVDGDGSGATEAAVMGVWYAENFLGLGPKFVCVVKEKGTLSLHHTSDGGSWVAVDPPADLDEFAATPSSPRARAWGIGDVVLLTHSDSTLIGVWDVKRGTTARIGVSGGTIASSAFDGRRLIVGASTYHYTSGPLTGLRTMTGTQMNESP